jgi:branched-chain amino acid transport system substrate-binding protein
VSFAALGYDSMYLIKDAIAKAGSTEPAAVRDALKATNGSYLTGKLSFDSKRNPVKSAVILEIVNRGGKLEPVYRTTVNP